ncbi:MAG TPA: MFS transporter [Blastocatellia bacterium]|nr:MFS transporter [Blastocatellia bacterium]
MRSSTIEATQTEANRALALVSLAVLLASSTWFSGTAAVPILRHAWGLSDSQSAWLTIAVQLGFISGTFLYSVLNLADRFNARRVFFISALLGGGFNLGFAWLASGLAAGAALRFLTGVTLAGVYPVGMKIVAMWFQSGLGWRLGVLVGALTLGTASPYLIQALGASFNWRALVATASLSAVAGGALILLGVRDGPYLKARARFDYSMALKVFGHRPFRYTAFGYFGHMWELYAFWSLSAFYLGARFQEHMAAWPSLIPALSFLSIGVGALGCAGGGWVSQRVGERKVALASLVISAACSALSGLAFGLHPALLLAFILIWGVFVVSDSPQFSALAAKYCPKEYTGTALTVQNGIGFAITIISIQLLPFIARMVGWQWAFTFLAAGPIAGAYFMSRLNDDG